MSTIERDRELVEGIAAESRTAIEALYREHFPMVASMIRQNSGNEDDAADIFQETVIVLFEKVRKGEFELQSLLKTFIYSVARRLWLKKLQQRAKVIYDTGGIEETVAVEEELELHLKKQEDFVLMESSMQKIGEPCKSLLQAYYLQKQNMTDIAASFGYTNADNAKTQKYKCLVRLKKLFFAEYKKRE